MSTVHLILQGKGGVGKSFAAFLLAQYLPDKSVLVRCFDADPINNTLANFPALNAVKVDLIENSDKGRRIGFTTHRDAPCKGRVMARPVLTLPTPDPSLPPSPPRFVFACR